MCRILRARGSVVFPSPLSRLPESISAARLVVLSDKARNAADDATVQLLKRNDPLLGGCGGTAGSASRRRTLFTLRDMLVKTLADYLGWSLDPISAQLIHTLIGLFPPRVYVQSKSLSLYYAGQ